MKQDAIIKKILSHKGVEKILDDEIIKMISGNIEHHRVHIFIKEGSQKKLGSVDYIVLKNTGEAHLLGKAQKPVKIG